MKTSDFSLLLDFASPAFFDVVPTLKVLGVISELTRNYSDKVGFADACRSFNASLAGPLDVSLFEKMDSGVNEPAKSSGSLVPSNAELALTIYFAQIFKADTAILDLRFSTFVGPKQWSPKPLFFRWDSHFRKAMTDIYSGFYDQDSERYAKGLHELQLDHASELFLAHFGSDQTAVKFKLENFKRSFHDVFLSCKEHRVKLHPNFFALGAYLLSLYEHLETADVTLNVRDCYKKARAL